MLSTEIESQILLTTFFTVYFFHVGKEINLTSINQYIAIQHTTYGRDRLSTQNGRLGNLKEPPFRIRILGEEGDMKQSI